MKIFHHWVNTLLLESSEYKIGFYEVAAYWSGIPTMQRKIVTLGNVQIIFY